MSSPISRWRGNFGDAYIERNELADQETAALARCFAEVLALTGSLNSICEVGANIGRNLRALARISTAELIAVEPNEKARKRLSEWLPADRVLDGQLGQRLPLPDGRADLAFTCGVLIHVPDEFLDAAYSELWRISSKWILTAEYFSPTRLEVPYQKLGGMLWKRDYGAPWLDRFGAEPVAHGFWWKHTTAMDDINWWLFRNPTAI